MRTKTRTTTQLKPGMVVRTQGIDANGTDLTLFRQVVKVDKLSIYSTAVVTFTDGTRADVGYGREFQVTRSKTVRNTAKTRAEQQTPGVIESALTLLGAYAVKAA